MKLHRFAIPAALLITGAFVAGACTIGTVEDDDFGGSGGQGGADGAATGGTSATGGAGGQGGDTGEVVDCQPDGEAEGTLASTDANGSDQPCEACQKAKCGELYAVCNAQGPQGACSFGSTEFDGMAIDGEFLCMNSCIASEGVADEDAIAFCAGECGSAECNPDSVSQVTLDLVNCLAIPTGDDSTVCLEECYPGL